MSNTLSVSPHLRLVDPEQAIAFYEKAFGAVEQGKRMLTPEGRILHTTLQLGETTLFVCDALCSQDRAPLTGNNVSLTMAVPDADAIFNAAIAAGATVRMPVETMFWGARYGEIVDPTGIVWSFNQHVSNPSEAEMKQGMEAALSSN